ncbi:unnamed protein product, partial [Vitis vinifera]|uniref:Uncharacterized protein n=1 Tax=Vitis vinifera TaxID=29760 RepID=D7TNH3_VITVI
MSKVKLYHSLVLVVGGNNNIKMINFNQFLNNNMHFLNVCYCLI